MHLIPAKELAARWGISPTRVGMLARAGRIPGACIIGRNWFIPQDALKPVDGRIHAVPPLPVDDRPFRFPFFVFQQGVGGVTREELSEEEQLLFDAQIHMVACRIQEACDILLPLRDRVTDPVLSVGLMHHLSICARALGMDEIADDALARLNALLMSDIPHRTELLLVKEELATYTKGNSFFLSAGIPESLAACHPSGRNYLYVLLTYRLYLRGMTGHTAEDTMVYELLTVQLEDNQAFFAAHCMHLYLAGYYHALLEQEKAAAHMHAFLRLCLEHDYLAMPILYYPFLGSLFDDVLRDFPADFAGRIRTDGTKLHNTFFCRKKGEEPTSVFSVLSRSDYEYLAFAYQHITTKEIARRKGLSVSTVFNRYASIFDKLHIHNRRELIELMNASTLDYFAAGRKENKPESDS